MVSWHTRGWGIGESGDGGSKGAKIVTVFAGLDGISTTGGITAGLQESGWLCSALPRVVFLTGLFRNSVTARDPLTSGFGQGEW
jgi:hypothetical protein